MASLPALAALHDAGAPSAAAERLERLRRAVEANGRLGASGPARGAATASSCEEGLEGGGSDLLVRDARIARALQEEELRKLLIAVGNDRAIAAALQEEFDIERRIERLRAALAERAAAARKKRVAPVRRAAVRHKKAKADEWRREHLEGQGSSSCGAPSRSRPGGSPSGPVCKSNLHRDRTVGPEMTVR